MVIYRVLDILECVYSATHKLSVAEWMSGVPVFCSSVTRLIWICKLGTVYTRVRSNYALRAVEKRVWFVVTLWLENLNIHVPQDFWGKEQRAYSYGTSHLEVEYQIMETFPICQCFYTEPPCQIRVWLRPTKLAVTVGRSSDSRWV